MGNLLDIIEILSWSMLFVLSIKVLFFLTLSGKHFRKARISRKRIGGYKPLVSIVVPCFNEELTLKNCVQSLLKQSYRNFEIIIVDDGSKDNTKSVGRYLAKRYPKRVKLLTKKNGGKASALNYGTQKALGELVVSMDADSMFLRDTLRQLVLSFYCPNTVAVGGNVRVANRHTFMNKHQAVEYITGLNLQRRSFAFMNCMQVISGAIGAFRKDKLLEIGGYSNDTIVEDMDVTVSIARTGGKVEYNGNAIAYTEAPEKITDFIKQRYRWTFGGFQVIKKHKDMLFNPKYKTLGLFGLPYFMLFPWADVFISLLFVMAILRVFFGGNPLELAFFYFIMTSVQGVLLYYSLAMDKENKKLALLAGIDSLWYNHVISLVTIKAGLNFLRGASVSWNKLPRLGRNSLLSMQSSTT